MANGSRATKRVLALRRASDGSAFLKCECCGVSVAVALSDMHECGGNGGRKRSKVEKEPSSFQDQPRSPFCCFMESFREKCKDQTLLEINRIGFDTWKNMSPDERRQYIIQAEKVNIAYQKILLKESENMSKVDDEADSAMVGKIDMHYEGSSDYEDSFESFESHEWDFSSSWLS
ncbi:high mobility group B protein 2 isoform X2 [Elaeis guineensis]|uniref:High mobility group B protein 7 isoform X2 n=1 Tax=Elaeis guineensis var. tenera TaxID=51953 RepID=A0A6I9R6C4_ELAGV|nr:high mobility group B protein 7 isoform X2 [Elaeis guineensis]